MAEHAIFGRYWEADSPIHKLDARTKFLGVIFMMIITFSATNFGALILVAVAVMALFRISRIPLKRALQSIVRYCSSSFSRRFSTCSGCREAQRFSSLAPSR